METIGFIAIITLLCVIIFLFIKVILLQRENKKLYTKTFQIPEIQREVKVLKQYQNQLISTVNLLNDVPPNKAYIEEFNAEKKRKEKDERDSNFKLPKNGTGISSPISDLRLKEKIVTIEEGLNVIKKLVPVRFNYIKNNPYNFDINTRFGFIAQETSKCSKELVSKNSEGYLEIDYYSIIALLVKSQQEILKEIENLKK